MRNFNRTEPATMLLDRLASVAGLLQHDKQLYLGYGVLPKARLQQRFYGGCCFLIAFRPSTPHAAYCEGNRSCLLSQEPVQLAMF